MNHPCEIRSGYQLVLECHSTHIACKSCDLKQEIDRKSGKVLEENQKMNKSPFLNVIQLSHTTNLLFRFHDENF